MSLKTSASAGIDQNDDVLVRISPEKRGGGIHITLQSPVAVQFGRAIEATIRQVLAAQGVTDAVVEVMDNGALDFTLRARLLAALSRAGLLLKSAGGRR